MIRELLIGGCALVGMAAFGGCEKPKPAVAATTRAEMVPQSRPEPEVGGDWPAFHGGGALEGDALPIGPPPMRVRWTYHTNEADPSGVDAAAAIVGDSVYVADQKGTLHAIELATGNRRWTYVAKRGFATTPLVLDGRVMLGDLAGTFHAVAAAEGKKLWAFDTGSEIHSSANALGKRVVFGDDDADIYCLEAADGKVAWQQKGGDRINGTPAVAGGAVYLCGCDAQLRAHECERRRGEIFHRNGRSFRRFPRRCR